MDSGIKGGCCITLRPGESVYVGDDVVVTANLKQRGIKQIRIVINAPGKLVLRESIYLGLKAK